MKLKCEELNHRQKSLKINADHAPEKHLYQAAIHDLKEKDVEMEDMKNTIQDITDWFPNFKHYGSSVLKKYLKMNAVGKVFLPVAQPQPQNTQNTTPNANGNNPDKDKSRVPPVRQPSPVTAATAVDDELLPQDFLVWDLKVTTQCSVFVSKCCTKWSTTFALTITIYIYKLTDN